MLNCLRSSFHDSSAARIAQIAPRAAPGTSLARAEATRRSRARSRSCPPAALALMVRPGTSCSTATRRALRAGSQRRRAPPRASWCARPPRGRLLGAWWVLRVSRCLCRLCTHTGRMSHAPSSCRQRLLLPRAGIPGGVPAGDCMDMAREQTSPVFHSAPLRCAGSRPQARLLRRAMGQSGASCCCTACPASRSRPWSGPRSVRAWPARSYCTAWLRCPGARSQSDLCACSHLQRPRHLHLS